jgi:predicted Zn-dependent protease
VLWTEQGRPEDAVTQLRAALETRPDDPVLCYLLADALLRARPDAKDEPRRLLEAAIQSRQQFPRAHALLGKLYRASGLADRAIAELQIALRQDPTNRQALQQLVLAFREGGRTQEAADAATRLRAELAVRGGSPGNQTARPER